ncbi:MAG: hypothetical protein CMM38_07860 [Rhodospirillaceae bacterium]|jgi:uncharacterized protein (DUF1330 family)|nr:hypothetical protein [Rhodospirillaceae bacterium]|tara:strand:- start:6920 stop:7231 length:312 start_codon:yes stop_codon:yes gene_type:complete
MPAYWLARAHIKDPVAYKNYTDKLPKLFEKYNARVLARGGEYKVLEGDKPPFERYIVIEFVTSKAAEDFFNSDDYTNAAAFRRAPGVAKNELVIVEGGDATPT